MTAAITARRLSLELGDWRGNSPAYHALADRIRVLLLDGRLGTGTRLPAERELGNALGVSRTTVAAAYAKLRADGYLDSVRGSGSTLALPFGSRGTVERAHVTEFPLDLTKATVPAYPGLAQYYTSAAALMPQYLGHHGFDMVGLIELRDAIAEHYTQRGLPTDPDQVMVTTGAQHALSLITHALHSPGERVLVEQPSYPHALDTFASAGARIVSFPVSATNGWDLTTADQVMRRTAPSLAYLMPDFHNPTGASMSVEDRSRLAGMAAREGTAMIVDETTAWLDLDRGPMPPFAAMAPAGANIVTVGSLGKIAWGGLRVGWIRAPRTVLARISQVRPAFDLGTPLLEQLVATAVLQGIHAVVSYRSSTLKAGRDHLAKELAAAFPEWNVQVPPGGMTLWVTTGT
ncbi:MAG: PLP-dependent aminotransferase family protein, partial [Acidobacteria bacterium]|nr:PLP-dependent aminotransferase family protein [Acidobacteriota bacterium]